MSLPPLYDRWIREELLEGAEIPEETEATCEDCTMCAKPGEDSPAALATYDPESKCCTYLPELHNFLAGRILTDETPDAQEGRLTVEARLDSRAGVTPLGLLKTRAYSLLYRNQVAGEFGRTKVLRCPHYLADGRCGVWRHRESTCATWYCKFVRGGVGIAFWKGVHRLLQHVERTVARHCVVELDPGSEALDRIFPAPGQAMTPSLDGPLPPDLYRAVWGRWAGKERAFFAGCARIVAGLAWKDAVAIAGPEARASARLLREAHDRLLSDELPERLRVGSWKVIDAMHTSTRVVAISPLDPIELPSSLMAVLPYFDGRPTTESLRTIAAERKLTLSPALVRRLVDFGILVAAGETAAAAASQALELPSFP